MVTVTNDLVTQLQNIVPKGSVDIFTFNSNYLAPFTIPDYFNLPEYIFSPYDEYDLGEFIKFANKINFNVTVTSS